MGGERGGPGAENRDLAGQVVRAASEAGATIVTAESCTGGLVASAVTSIPGSSRVFWGAFVTYADEAKRELLGVRDETLRSHGAVSEQTVVEMAAGALERSGAGYAVAISGVAGPSGGTPEKPVGTVWIGWCSRAGGDGARRFRYDGNRAAIREQATGEALRVFLTLLSSG